MQKRNNYIDWLKGFAIFAVVFGHCWMRDEALYWFIYRFHMVLFMTISGYLFNAKRGFKEFLFKKAKSMLLPYMMFSLFSMAVSIIFLGGSVSDIPIYFFGMVMGGKFCLLYNNWTLWYLPLMFIVSVIMYFVVNKWQKFYKYILVGAFLIILPLNLFLRHICHNGYIPFSMQVIPVGLVCMMIGYGLRKSGYNGELFANQKINSIVAVLAGLLGYLISLGSNATVINPKNIMMIPAALLICHMIVVLTKDSHNKAIAFLGRNSLYILGLHRPILYVLEKRTGLEKFLVSFNITGPVACFFISVLVILGILVCIIAVSELKKRIKTQKNQTYVDIA